MRKRLLKAEALARMLAGTSIRLSAPGRRSKPTDSRDHIVGRYGNSRLRRYKSRQSKVTASTTNE